jgi:hypothetical protein
MCLQEQGVCITWWRLTSTLDRTRPHNQTAPQIDSVVVAKMDGTENEHADVDVKGFPTILFFPADADKKAISFEGGDRSLKVSERV